VSSSSSPFQSDAPASASSRLPHVDAKLLREAIERHVVFSLGERWEDLGAHDVFMAVSLAARDLLMRGLIDTEARAETARAKRVYYLSLEFLIGRSLASNLLNLGIYDACREAVRQLGGDLDDLLETERDAALGNGGLGRLAACFLDSLATLGYAGHGYGINYDYGLFRQQIVGGHQIERPDSWRKLGTPWLIERPDEALLIPMYGHLEPGPTPKGDDPPRSRWVGWRVLAGVPSDMPIVGYGAHTVNRLRLYQARATDEFDMQIFNTSDYMQAVQQHTALETISLVLYPPASSDAGKELRLLQEYFFVACALRDILARFRRRHGYSADLSQGVAVHLNDTHPALAVAELMRLFVDEENMPWQAAWETTQRTLAYTNHTLLPEALETWPQPLFAAVLPRHNEIVEQINDRFLKVVVSRWPGDLDRMRRMSIIQEGTPKHVRMANLAIVGSHATNGVAQLHTRLLRSDLVPDFAELWPERFHNKTNGITPRRWLHQANPRLSDLISARIGSEWITDLERIHELEPYADDSEFRVGFRAVKRHNKQALARLLQDTAGVSVSVDALFDVQVKRIHEYKRQLLAVMHAIHEYLLLVEEGQAPDAPKVYVFGGKAAPDYFMAKLTIRLIHGVASLVNSDPRVDGALRVAFVPDYRVSLAERIIPAADLSEQISTAGKEASGTGNMKFALNGALTIGTLDGANVEIRDAVGEENIYIFGLRAEEVRELRKSGGYDPREWYQRSADVRRVMDAIASDRFCDGEGGLFRPIWDRLIEHGDEYFHLADFDDYAATQRRAAHDYADRDDWARRAILNVARMGRFSSDRVIREYATETWRLEPVR
jgi:starch phosphorylase